MNCNFNKNIVLYSDVAALLAQANERVKELEDGTSDYLKALKTLEAQLAQLRTENAVLKERLKWWDEHGDKYVLVMKEEWQALTAQDKC
jgi:cell shape-determining protein MreC